MAKPLFEAPRKQYYPLAQDDPEFRNRALLCLSGYVAISEAAGTPFRSLQEMFAKEENAQIKDNAIEEIQLWVAQSIYKSILICYKISSISIS